MCKQVLSSAGGQPGGQPGGDQELAGDQQNSDTSFVEGEETVNIPIPKNNNLLDTFV